MSSADDYIKNLVDSAPPLTAEQRNRLAVHLRRDEVTKPATTVDDIVDEHDARGAGFAPQAFP